MQQPNTQAKSQNVDTKRHQQEHHHCHCVGPCYTLHGHKPHTRSHLSLSVMHSMHASMSAVELQAQTTTCAHLARRAAAPEAAAAAA